MARRKSSSSAGSLDSLLDTLTNVVGILIIIMVLMQVSVGESVKRMEGIDGPLLELTDEDVKRAEQEAVEVSSRLKELLEATANLNLAVEQRALDEKQRSLAQLEKNLASLQGKINLDEVRKQLEEVQKKETALEKEVLAAQEEIAKLKAQLANTPEPQGVAATIVTLPDPRPAPEKAQPAIFMVRKGRVVPVDVQRLKGIVSNVINSYVDPKSKRIDAEKALKVFNNQKRSTYGVNLALKNINENIYLVVTPDDDAGEAGDKVDGSTSTFRRLVRRINPKQNYVRFLVWADSFPDYLAARSVVEEYGLMAGWEAYVPDQEYRIWIGQTTAYKPPPKQQTPQRPTLPVEQVD